MCEHQFRMSPYITCQFLLNLVCITEICVHPFRISPDTTYNFLYNLVHIKENV